MYAEDFRDGRAFVDAGRRRRASRWCCMTVGASAASARAAQSHTGALVSDVAVVAAAARAAGVHLVRTPHEMIDLVQALVRTHPLRGPRIAVVGDGGGHGAIACDVASAAGLELPRALRCALGRAGRAAAGDRRHPQPGRPGRRRRAGLPLLRPRVTDAARVGRGRRRAPDRVLRRLQPVLRDVRRRSRSTSRATSRSPSPRRAGTMVAQTMYAALADRRGAARGRRAGLHDDRGGRRGARRPARATAAPAGAPSLPPVQTGPIEPGYFGSRALLGGGRRAVRAAVAVRTRERGAGGRRRARLSGGREGRRRAAQVRRGRSRRRDRRSRPALVEAVRDLTGRLAPEALSVERMAPLHEGVELIVGARRRPALRAGRDGRPGRHLRRGVRRRGRRPGAGRRRGGGAAAALAARRVAPDRHPRTAAARHRRCGGGRGDALARGRRPARHRRDRDQPAARHARGGGRAGRADHTARGRSIAMLVERQLRRARWR